MKSPTKISALQFYLMLFLSRVVITLTVNSQTVGEANFLDNILSSVLLMLVLFIFSLPLFSLHKRHPQLSLPAIAEARFDGIGIGVSMLYAAYFLLMNTHSLSMFLTLVLNTMDPAASKWSIAIVLTGIALYGAVKGIETISRASICIFALFSIGFIALFVALIPQANLRYAEPLLYDGTDQMLRGAAAFASRCTTLAELAVLMPFAEGKMRRGFAIWNVSTALFVSGLLAILVLCLGEYAYLQIFPVYTLATIAEIAGIQRLDALIIGLSMMALVIRMASGLFAISECVNRIVKPCIRVWVVSTASVVSVIAALWITTDAQRSGWIFKTQWLLPGAIITGVIVPVIIWVLDLFRKRGKTA